MSTTIGSIAPLGMSQTRLACRWISSRVPTSALLDKAIHAEDWAVIQEAFEQVLGLVGASSTQQEIGSSWSIQADWYYALGPRLKNRVQRLIQSVLQLRRSIRPGMNTKALAALVPEILWLESLARSQKNNDGQSHGPFTYYVMPGVSRPKLREALDALDQATKFLHGFPQVLYGDIYFSPTVAGKGHAVALYVPSKDIVYVGMTAKKVVGDVHAICHEFGHRYYHRFWKDTQARNRFMQLSTSTEYEMVHLSPRQKQALTSEYMKAIRAKGKGKPLSKSLEGYLVAISKNDTAGFNYLRRLATEATLGGSKEEAALMAAFDRIAPMSWSTGKVLHEPLAVTPYGATDWHENFAEAFAHLVMGKRMPPALQAIMDGLK